MSNTELTTTQSAGAVAVIDYGDDAGSGFENQTGADYAIPFLGILQSNSPQVEESDTLRAGQLYNTVTEQAYNGNDGLLFVPGYADHCFIEWVPRKDGGGFVSRREVSDPIVVEARGSAEEFGKFRTPEGNDLQETYYLYGALCTPDGQIQPAVIAFTSTKIKVYRKFMTTVKMFQVPTGEGDKRICPPLFAHCVRITTTAQKNKKGSFFNFVLAPANGDLASSLLKRDDARYQSAKACAELVKSGKAAAAYDKQDRDASVADEDASDVF